MSCDLDRLTKCVSLLAAEFLSPEVQLCSQFARKAGLSAWPCDAHCTGVLLELSMKFSQASSC